MSDQQLGHLVVAVGAGVVEGHQAAAQRDTPLLHRPALYRHLASRARPPFVLGVHISPVVQQVLHHRHSVVASSKMKRSGVSALQVPTVHVLGRAQRLQTETRLELSRRPRGRPNGAGRTHRASRESFPAEPQQVCTRF